MFALPGGHHGPGHTEPEDHQANQDIAPHQAGAHQIAQHDLVEGQPHGGGQQRRDDEIFHAVYNGLQAGQAVDGLVCGHGFWACRDRKAARCFSSSAIISGLK